MSLEKIINLKKEKDILEEKNQEFKKKKERIYEETGFINFEHVGEGIQLNINYFMEFFSDKFFSIKKRNDFEYPIQVVCYYNEIKFYSILNSEDINKYKENLSGERLTEIKNELLPF